MTVTVTDTREEKGDSPDQTDSKGSEDNTQAQGMYYTFIKLLCLKIRQMYRVWWVCRFDEIRFQIFRGLDEIGMAKKEDLLGDIATHFWSSHWRWRGLRVL